MKRITSTIKQKIIDKYSSSSIVKNATPSKNSQQKTTDIRRSTSGLSAKTGNQCSKKGPSNNFTQNSFDNRRNTKEIPQNDPWFTEVAQKTGSHFSRMTCGSSENTNSRQRKNEQTGNYFVKPQDLRSKSNSNIGCGLN